MITPVWQAFRNVTRIENIALQEAKFAKDIRSTVIKKIKGNDPLKKQYLRMINEDLIPIVVQNNVDKTMNYSMLPEDPLESDDVTRCTKDTYTRYMKSFPYYERISISYADKQLDLTVSSNEVFCYDEEHVGFFGDLLVQPFNPITFEKALRGFYIVNVRK